jgi:hypothetical protein
MCRQTRRTIHERLSIILFLFVSTAISFGCAEGVGNSPNGNSNEATLSVSPSAASVFLGATQQFQAAMNGSAQSNVTWQVNGVAGGDATLGVISSAGMYTAPQVLPPSTNITITAADGTASATAAVTLEASLSVSISPSTASVPNGGSQLFTANFAASGDPSQALVWSVGGIVGGNSVVGTVAPDGALGGVYTAPVTIPSPATLTVTATSVADPAKTASAAVTVVCADSGAISPALATVSLAQTQTFTASFCGPLASPLQWDVNGVLGGSVAAGTIMSSGTSTAVYTAPSSLLSTTTVTIHASIGASQIAQASVTILAPATAPAPIAVSVTPAYAFLAPSSTNQPSEQQFYASVSGGSGSGANGVTWSVQSPVPGQGCSGAACGSITAAGVYAAPSSASSPNAIQVTATSVADSSKSASATVAITSAPTIEVLLPSSVAAGAVQSFPLSIEGVNFVAGSGNGASTILINGAPAATTCGSSTVCATSLKPSQVQVAGTLTIQIQNPAAPALSNPVPFVVAPFSASQDIVSLTASSSAAMAEDITVTEATTAASGSPLSVQAAGPASANNCELQGSAVSITRPSSGSETAGLCVLGTNLDPGFTYSFTGPSGEPLGDISVTATAIPNLLPGLLELNLQVSSATQAGLRSLIVSSPNGDRAVVTGLLEVQ